ncbi:XFP C-terminal domain-containing protein [Zychaea mexicana]|uniref:XFP C-terminal domain-containing protein n=1 Tax=Zychaea mexicana TaxID=64656 RepID=UPI0022FEDAE8|nr:XFP C-terminal domain-containing protein [Zychaea mexicana]KAI9494780.1 XFP C-terminal domain-containing protein [Zychaea mexicana]
MPSFLRLGQKTVWRRPVPSMNCIEVKKAIFFTCVSSSTLWRQEHNGLGQENPAFWNNLINLKSNMMRIYLPPDAYCMVSTIDHCSRSTNCTNLVISAKNPTPLWITSAEKASEHCRVGVSVWSEYSTDGGKKPDVVIAGCGVETAFEAVAAAASPNKDCPDLRVRLVNVTVLMVLGQTHSHKLSQDEFEAIFTPDNPSFFNFHG